MPHVQFRIAVLQIFKRGTKYSHILNIVVVFNSISNTNSTCNRLQWFKYILLQIIVPKLLELQLIIIITEIPKIYTKIDTPKIFLQAQLTQVRLRRSYGSGWSSVECFCDCRCLVIEIQQSQSQPIDTFPVYTCKSIYVYNIYPHDLRIYYV